MRIADVLRGKGTEVATVPPRATVAEMLAELAEHNVGAVVVLDGERVAGIASERDVVRSLRTRPTGLLEAPVAEIMTELVATCTPEDSVDDLAALMTQRRVRHIPVVVDGRLVGIVSIGDVVKTRMEELEQSKEQLEAYISNG